MEHVRQLDRMHLGIDAVFQPDAASLLVVSGRPLSRRGLSQTLDATADLRAAASVASGKAALTALRRRGPFSAVVVDLRAPGSLLLALQAEAPAIPVVVVSARPEAVAGVNALRQGAVGFVDRNGPPEQIVEAVRTVLAGRRYVSASLGAALARSYGAAGGSRRLSDRQREVVMLIASGLTRSEIAERLSVAPGTVTTYRRRAAEVLGLRTDADLTRFAIREGLIELD